MGPGVNNLANIESLLNICANLNELAAIRIGASLFFAAVLVAFMRKGILVLKYGGSALLAFIIGLASPGIISLCMCLLRDAKNEPALMALSIACAMVAIVLIMVAFALLYLPVYIGKKRGRNLSWIIGLSAFSILFPPLWAVSVFLAHKGKDTKGEEPVATRGHR